MKPTKIYDVAAISSCAMDLISFIPEIVPDGRVKLLRRMAAIPGGLGSNGLNAIRFVPGKTAVGGIIGDDEAGSRFVVSNRQRGINTDFVIRSDEGHTNENQILQSNGSRLIVKDRGVQQPPHFPLVWKERFLLLAEQTRCLLIGILPMDWTVALAEAAKSYGTFFCVAPGDQQLSQLAEIPCDLMVVNESESREACDSPSSTSERDAFLRLIESTQADRLVQTGGGDYPAYLFDRLANRIWAAPPAEVKKILKRSHRLMLCGCGDVVTAATARSLIEGHPLNVAYGRWGRKLATAHLIGQQFNSVHDADQWFDNNDAAFPLVEELQLEQLMETKAA